MKYVSAMLIALSLYGCAAGLSVSEVEVMKEDASNLMGVGAEELERVSPCAFTVTAKTSSSGNWQPCRLVETRSSIHVLSRDKVAVSTEYENILSVGLAKNYARHGVQLDIGNAILEIQITKKYDLVDDEAVYALYARVKDRGIKVNSSAKHIESETSVIPIIVPK